eukprot:TRINITY_DN2083_c0_g1_i4.p1 TRINITY_DN2083_c0_g1~~TRINITY_DN2083_c0_g1_i4.p1  ORF type:complete len:203 (-),score=48.17 TRINITY_DN2083_c0_g1_i4:471-1079(-)
MKASQATAIVALTLASSATAFSPATSTFGGSQLCAAPVQHTCSTQMVFKLGAPKATSTASSRPTAGATTKGLKKTPVASDSSWNGPAVERRRQAQAIAAKKAAEKAAEAGVFSPEQYEKFLDARATVPSGASNYWQCIADKVPGQNAENCKKMASQLLFEKAVGTKKNFFGGYVETIEVKDYVDEDADVMGKLANMFSFGKK